MGQWPRLFRTIQLRPWDSPGALWQPKRCGEPTLEGEVQHEAPRVHHAARECGSVAAVGEGAAAESQCLLVTAERDFDGRVIMKKTLFAVMAFISIGVATAEAAPCLIVTLTGTQSGPPAFNGLAGAGTLVRYGDDANNCGAVKLQFDAGRGTNMRLSQVGVLPG